MSILTVVFFGAIDIKMSLAEERAVVLGLDFDHVLGVVWILDT